MKHIAFIITFFIALPLFANYENYDEIVDKLSDYQQQNLTNQAYRSEIRTLSRAHIGLGVAQTFFDPNAAGLNSNIQNQGGIAVNIGVDVLSTRWGVEGSYSNYGSHNTSNSNIKLREFTIKGLYKPSINKTWTMRLGLGVSSRFLDIVNPAINANYKTPSGLFMIGLDSYINQFISVGADLNFKTAMISDTIDKNSVDLAFRIDTHF